MGTEVEEGKQMPCRLVAVNNYEDLLVLVDEAMARWPIGIAAAEKWVGSFCRWVNRRLLVVERSEFPILRVAKCVSEN